MKSVKPLITKKICAQREIDEGAYIKKIKYAQVERLRSAEEELQDVERLRSAEEELQDVERQRERELSALDQCSAEEELQRGTAPISKKYPRVSLCRGYIKKRGHRETKGFTRPSKRRKKIF